MSSAKCLNWSIVTRAHVPRHAAEARAARQAVLAADQPYQSTLFFQCSEGYTTSHFSTAGFRGKVKYLCTSSGLFVSQVRRSHRQPHRSHLLHSPAARIVEGRGHANLLTNSDRQKAKWKVTGYSLWPDPEP